MDTVNDKNKFLLSIITGLLVIILIVNIENIKVMKEIHSTLSANNQQTITNNGTTNNNTATNDKIDTSLDNIEAEYKLYTDYYTLPDDSLKKSRPYLKDSDLLEYGCPICRYQLYCFGSAGSAAMSCLRCTNCNWESAEVHIKNCNDSSEAKKILLDLLKKGELTKDIEFQYAWDYEWD